MFKTVAGVLEIRLRVLPKLVKLGPGSVPEWFWQGFERDVVLNGSFGRSKMEVFDVSAGGNMERAEIGTTRQTTLSLWQAQGSAEILYTYDRF